MKAFNPRDVNPRAGKLKQPFLTPVRLDGEEMKAICSI